MSNLLVAKLEDHISGKVRDLDIELALSKVERLGYNRQDIIRRFLLGLPVDPNVLSVMIRVTNYHDGIIINRFPRQLQNFVEETLREYYRRRDEW